MRLHGRLKARTTPHLRPAPSSCLQVDRGDASPRAQKKLPGGPTNALSNNRTVRRHHHQLN